MSELIEAVQLQEPGSELVELYELTVNNTILYFHAGLEEDLTEVQFRDRTSPYTARTYIAFPIMMDGVDLSADGAINRPTLTVANVANTFSSAIGDIKAEDLVGERLTKRTTLKKYLVGESGDTSPSVEFPIRKFILDRISGENNVSVSYELAAPYDLSGITIPNRKVVGKYCSWQYQGYGLSEKGGCIWSKDSVVSYSDGSGGVNTHKAYFTEDDEPVVPAGSTMTGWTAGQYKTYTTYSSGTSYSSGDYVEYNDGNQTTVWKCTLATTGNAPGLNSIYWSKGDVCGKKLSSCKCRFQFKPQSPSGSNSDPSTEKNTGKILPFGAFIGSMKFR
jgi:lambda family phage minor tail protein L